MMATNRSGIDTLVNGCAFHKGKTLKDMTNRFVAAARACRKSGAPGFAKATSALLDGHLNYHALFGNLIDQCMQHDDPDVGLLLWDLVLQKARMIGMVDCADHINKYHHPVHGRQGVWGRWNHYQEGSLEEKLAYTGPLPYRGEIVYGSSSTSNALEGRMNKLMKSATKNSLSYGALSTRAQRVLTTLSRTMTEVVFSLIGDQLGESVSNLSRKQSGWKQVQKTGTTIPDQHNLRHILNPPSPFRHLSHPWHYPSSAAY